MIKGIGTDIVQISRVAKALERTGEAFARRVLTRNELNHWQTLVPATQVSYLAKRFAVKEAVAKAFGTGIGALSFQHIETHRGEHGEPLIKMCDFGAQLQADRGVEKVHVSISDEREYAIAFVVLE